MEYLILVLIAGAFGVICHKQIKTHYFLASILGALLATVFEIGLTSLATFIDSYRFSMDFSMGLFFLFVFQIPITAIAGIPLYFLRPRTQPQGFCSTCGYNLTGLSINRCPECGSSFNCETSNQNEPPHSDVHIKRTELAFWILIQILFAMIICASVLLLWASLVFAGEEKLFDKSGIWLWSELALSCLVLIILNLKRRVTSNWPLILILLFASLAVGLFAWWGNYA